ncbi:uncharacterized protein ARMOST_02941 [Armillaria ostoyae]|uniref:HTH CENPB-type domain-containing protein n=1 Tax=Armillaria ostoyae TaxID=47428 RepID=A0A284QTA4_ARMOS|nr:uncharacterized protein ARMOST_02941 [Armillaria ostoyae]
MPGHAKSNTKKSQIQGELMEKWLQIAAEAYQTEQTQELLPMERWKGYGEICKEAIESCWKETHQHIHLSRSTLRRIVKGGQTMCEFNAGKRWLLPEEEEVILKYAISLAERGFPCSQRRLREHINSILEAHEDPNFEPVGENFVGCWAERHSERLKPFWSHALDHSRVRAVNVYTKEGYFKLLKETIEGRDDKEPIAPELIFGTDETGIQKGIGTSERVYGPANRSVQHQQRSGDRENIMVIETICADGTSLAPSVIFKGEGYQVSWKQENPLNALYVPAIILVKFSFNIHTWNRLGYFKKGYTDGEIGVAWITNFDKQTKAKAGGK